MRLRRKLYRLNASTAGAPALMGSELSRNFFELFDLPVEFRLDTRDLAQRYRALQGTTHPDRYASAGEQERLLAVQKAALVNEAYQTLKRPLSRARYLLELRGVTFDGERDTAVDPEFLMQQMELREALAEVPAATQPMQEYNALLERLEAVSRQLEDRLAQLLGSDEAAAQAEAKDLVLKLQFMDKLHQEAEALEETLLDAP